MANELSVRVRRIDDLPELLADGQDEFFQFGDRDQFLVSHVRNVNEDTDANVSYSRKLTAGSLKTSIANHIKDQLTSDWLKNIHISDLADGDNFMSEITKTLQEIKSQEQNSFMENSYYREQDYVLEKIRIDGEDGGKISAFVTPTSHTFLQDTNAYVHVSFRNENQLTTVTNALDVMTVQIKSGTQGWYTICSEPLNVTARGITEIDLHAFFYAGTEMKVWYKKLGKNTVLSSNNFSGTGYMTVCETSNEKPFPLNSFTWRSSIPKNLSGTSIAENTSEPNQKVISSDGFIYAHGKYCNSNAESQDATKGKTTYTKTQAWNTPCVYIAQISGENSYKILGNTQNLIPYAQTKVAVDSGFSERYFYVNKPQTSNISVVAFSDVRMNDDKGNSVVAGLKNQTTFSYYDKSEIGFALDGVEDDSELSNLEPKFTDGNYHIFKYGKLLGRPSGPAIYGKIASEYGTIRKSVAYAGVNSNGPNFIRSKKTSDLNDEWVYSIGDSDSGMYCQVVKYTLPQSKMDGNSFPILSSLVSTITITTGTTFTEGEINNVNQLCGSVEYEIDILDKNVTSLRCFPINVSNFKDTQQNGNTDIVAKYQNFHDAGAPLVSVRFATDSNISNVCIDDSAFAFCTQLSDINIPVGMSMNGNNTFDMGVDYKQNTYQRLKATISNARVSKIETVKGILAPNLRQVVFGYDSSRGEIFNGYPPESALIHIQDISENNRGLYKTFRSCINLSSANIQFTDANVLSGTFSNCSSLTSVVFPKSMQKIYNTTFSGCKQLSSITLNCGIDYSQTKAFDGASTALTSVNSNQRYKLGRDYYIGIMLSGKMEDYYDDSQNEIDKDAIWNEIIGSLKVITYTTPFGGTAQKVSRRIFILDKDGKNITQGKNPDGDRLVFNPFKSGSDTEPMSTKLKGNWEDHFNKDNLKFYDDDPSI